MRLVPTGGRGGGGGHRALCRPCAGAVRKEGYFGPIGPPHGQGDRCNFCGPMDRTARIPTQSQNSDNESNSLRFPLQMPDCCLNLLFLPRGRMLPRWWVVTVKLNYKWALCPRCARAVQKRPPGMDMIVTNLFWWGWGGGGGARAPAAAADRKQQPDATCEGKNG